MIPYGRQDISQDDIDAVVEVLRSDFLTQGPKVPEFEKSIQTYTGAAHAVAVNSATSALHVACLALGLGEGDCLWTSPITFVASANCALYCGAKVDFVDIDSRTGGLCPEALQEKLELAEREGKLPKIVIPVHLSGHSCDMRAIKSLADKYGFRIIEDASHAIGGKYLGRPVGCCEFSDITVFSFHPVKIITTAEGGMATTNSVQLAEKMALLRSHGITRQAELLHHASEGQWYYEQHLLGFNYRMTDIQAALGVSQMCRLDEIVTKRHDLAQRYQSTLGDFPLILPFQLEGVYSAFHLYIIRLKSDLIGPGRKEVFDSLRQQGVGVNVHYIPVHIQPYYRSLGFEVGDYPAAEAYYSTSVSLPLYPTLSVVDQDHVISSLRYALEVGE